ncbi:hypothetical protein N9J88_03080 [Porticoccaceae bacterium]|nr:hypothetical protein [Porticoccaceae bacterium]
MKHRFIIILLLLYCNTGWSTVCKVQTGEVEVLKKRYIASEVIERCTGEVKPVTKSAEFCFFNNAKQWNCQQLVRGAEPSVKVSDLVFNADYKSSFISAWLAVLNPIVNKPYGGKRLKETDYLPGFPYGEVLMPETSLTLNAQFKVKSQDFILMDADSNKIIFTTDRPLSNIQIPRSKLRAEGNYKWALKSHDKTFLGKFSIASKSDQREFEGDFENATGAGLGPVATLVLQATVAKEYGYTFDYQRLLQAAKKHINSKK